MDNACEQPMKMAQGSFNWFEVYLVGEKNSKNNILWTEKIIIHLNSSYFFLLVYLVINFISV